MEGLSPVGMWGELRGNEEYISPMTPVFRDGGGAPFTTGIAGGAWRRDDLKNIGGQEDYTRPYGELAELIPEDFEDGWYLWTMGPRLVSVLEGAGVSWTELLPTGRPVGAYQGLPTFVAYPSEVEALREVLRAHLDGLWMPVLLNPGLQNEHTDLYLEFATKLNRRASVWGSLAYRYVTGDERALDSELRRNGLRGWERGEWGDREWARGKIEELLDGLRSDSTGEGN